MKSLNTARSLSKALVKTRVGYELGYFKDFEVDFETLNIISIIVTPLNLAKKLLGAELVVPKDKIISISPELIIVDDTLAPLKNSRITAKEFSQSIAANTGSALTSKNEFSR